MYAKHAAKVAAAATGPSSNGLSFPRGRNEVKERKARGVAVATEENLTSFDVLVVLPYP